ncbi:MAG: alpha/beta hydrolase family esterase [Micavibrio sp.]
MIKLILMTIAILICTDIAYAETLSYQGRAYEVHRPQSLSQDRNAPLLIVLHGGLGNAKRIKLHLGLDSVADTQGFIVAYLNGNPGQRKFMKDKLTWNAGGGCCGSAAKNAADDVTYIEGFIEHMIANHSVDAARIYIAGHSNGAMMAYRFSCEKPGIVAAMVAVSGTLMVDHCNARDLRVLHIHGDRDDHVPVAGGIGTRSLMRDMNYRSLDETARIMKESGASFNLKLVRGAGHSTNDLNKILQKNDSTTLAEAISLFILENEIP